MPIYDSSNRSENPFFNQVKVPSYILRICFQAVGAKLLENVRYSRITEKDYDTTKCKTNEV